MIVPPVLLPITCLEQRDRHPDKRQGDQYNDDFNAVHEAVINAQMRLGLFVKTVGIHMKKLPRQMALVNVVMAHGCAEINL